MLLAKPLAAEPQPSTDTDNAQPADAIIEQRARYQQALGLIQAGRTSQGLKLAKTLQDYPLYPYLRFQYLLKRLRYLPTQDVQRFLTNHSDTPLAARLQHRWLRTLARYGKWSLYLQQYPDTIQSTELQCYALWAQHKTGNTEAALAKIEALWLVPHSQPDACDPLFKLWRDNGGLTEALAWQRFTMAMGNRKLSLARYLIRFLPKAKQDTAWLYRNTYLQPNRLGTLRHYPHGADHIEHIILAGMKRLALRDPKLALKLWPRYQQQHPFTDNEKATVTRTIVLGLAKKNEAELYDQHLGHYAFPDDPDIVEAELLMALRLQDWPRVLTGVARLPAALSRDSRWQYWLARAHQQAQGTDSPEAADIYSSLAQSRDYYGFLAASRLELPYQLNHKIYPIDRDFMSHFKTLPAVIRALELLQQNDLTNARREWNYATRGLDNGKLYSAAYTAHEADWPIQAIRSAIAAQHWHDLNLRFPLLYQPYFRQAADKLQLDPNWLTAVARQESAFMPDAVSHKKATGLMQLLPSTAKAVARKHKLPYRNRRDLLIPERNIALGSHYLYSLLGRFDNNHVYASAAYNAGPHRVNRWLTERPDLANDIWIENIPFRETRQYVKNVMAYSVIFALRQQQTDYQMPIDPLFSQDN